MSPGPDFRGTNRQRSVSYFTLRRLSKKCKVAKNPMMFGGQVRRADSSAPASSSPWASACCRTDFLFRDPGSVLKGGVNVCQRQLVNEVLGPLVTEFVPNFGREGATPI